MKLLPTNAKLIEKRFPRVYALLGRNSNQMSSYSFDDNKLTCKFKENRVHPYGRADADVLINRWTEGLELKSGGLYALGGIGTGRHIKALLDKADKQAYVFLAEQDIGWLYQLLSKVDCSDILADERFLLAAGDVNDEMFKVLSGLNLNLIKDAKPLVYAPLHHLAEEYYNEYLMAFAKYLGVARKMQQTNVEDSGMWQECTLRNLKHLMLAPDVGETRGMFDGLPLVMVSAGPSLDQSLEFLKSAKSKAVIVCVNTAYRAMVNAGVKPHFTIAADPRMSTYRGYEGQDIEGVYLICSHFVNTEVASMFKNKAFTWSTGNKLVNLVRKRLGLGPATSVIEQGTIAASVFSLAKLWGCNKVCFVGQDLAVCQDGRGHASDTFYNDYGELYEELDGCRKLPGNVEKEVLVEEKLYAYLKVFNQLVKEYDSIDYINTSELGVKIDGVPYKNFDEAEKWLGASKVEGVGKQLAGITGSGTAPGLTKKKMSHALDTIRDLSDRVFTKSLEAGLYVQLLPEKMASSAYAENSGIKRASEYSKELKKITDFYPEETQVLFDGTTKKELHRYMDFCRSQASEHKHWDVVLKNKEYYWALAEGAYRLLSTIESELE